MPCSCPCAQQNQPHSAPPDEGLPSVATPEPPEATGQSPAPQLFLCLLRVVTGRGGLALRGTAPSAPISSARGPTPSRGGEAVTHIPSSSRSSLPSPLTDVRTAGGRGRDQSHSGLLGELLVHLEREGHSLAPLGSFLRQSVASGSWLLPQHPPHATSRAPGTWIPPPSVPFEG